MSQQQEDGSSQSQPCGAPESAATTSEPSAEFSRTDFVLLKMKANNVAEAAHLCYWVDGGTFHRQDLLGQFAELAEMVARFRQAEAA
jgi:hypothetical protein